MIETRSLDQGVTFHGLMSSAAANSIACTDLLQCPATPPSTIDTCELDDPARSYYGRLSSENFGGEIENRALAAELRFEEVLAITSPVALELTLPITIRGLLSSSTQTPISVAAGRIEVTGSVAGQGVNSLTNYLDAGGVTRVNGSPASSAGFLLNENVGPTFSVPAGTTNISLSVTASIAAYGEFGFIPTLSSQNTYDGEMRMLMPEGITIERLRAANGDPLPLGFRAVSANTGLVYEDEAAVHAQSTTFCPGTANSTGVAASIRAEGSVLLGASDLELHGTNLPVSTLAMAVFGDGTSTIPLGNGTLCVGPAPRRMGAPIAVDPAGDVTFDVDFSSPLLNSSYARIDPGTRYAFQFWYRDPGFGTGSGLTNATTVTFGL